MNTKRGAVLQQNIPAPAKSVKSELLAPAGSIEAFFAALDHGADAVYCGLKEFSARARARNFTLADVERMTSYAHSQKRHLYITLNTLIKEAELPKLVDLLASLAAIPVDGLIIQDLGVWRLARHHFPQLSLHASTQMTVHNAAGVKMLEQMGFTRAVLARELSLAEITEVRSQTSIELEHFVHGALCFSISGQCLFSSALTGMSGNRGRCAQPCRRRLHNRKQPGYHFSTSDLSAIEVLPKLLKAGVMSFKIEGRMKSAEYVARVVAAYRLMLDAYESQRKTALLEAAEHLELSFGRQATKGFLTGFVPTGIADSAQHGGLGRPLGEVASLRGGTIGFTSKERLHVGDRIRIQPQNDQAGISFTVRELFREKKKVKVVKAGDFVQVKIPEKGFFRVGDAVLKVGGRPLFTLSPDACLERLAKVALSPRTEEHVRMRETSVAQALAALLPKITVEPTAMPELTVRGREIHDIGLLDDQQQVAFMELSLTSRNLAALKGVERQLAQKKERLTWEIPAMLFGPDWIEYRRAVQMLHGSGYRGFRINNLGHIPLFAGLADVILLGGFRCYTLNSQAALAWQELGLAELTLSLEDEQKNISDLFHRPLTIPLTLTVYSAVTLLLSRIPIKGLRSGNVLHSDKEEEYRVITDSGLTEVMSCQDFSLVGRLRELKEMG
ncbi:MAG: U32 family peptidase, partial [Proteobacteria bacterium]|nr:U32 family peptidase [Pseudomonadota bacterium]